MLNSIRLFNIRREKENISQIYLSYLKSLYILFFYYIAKITVFDKIFFG